MRIGAISAPTKRTVLAVHDQNRVSGDTTVGDRQGSIRHRRISPMERASPAKWVDDVGSRSGLQHQEGLAIFSGATAPELHRISHRPRLALAEPGTTVGIPQQRCQIPAALALHSAG